MGEKPEEIRREIELARSRLDQDLNRLEYEFKRNTDWRVQFELHPWAFLGAAFGGGVLLGLITGRPAVR